jgi:hypothetical protein
MSRFWKTLRWFVVVGSGLFIVAQFFGPTKTNPPLDQAMTLQSSAHVTPQVASILDRSCNDCHSNNTRWPWYSNVAPVSWFVIDHVNEGRRDMNFSEWGRYDGRRRTGQLNQICQEVKSGAMPLGSYTPLHRGSKLTPDDVKTLCDWATAERSRMSDML